MFNEHFHFFDEIGRNFVHRQSAKVLDLSAEDENGNAAGKSCCDRIRDEFDHASQTCQSHDQKQATRHHRADGKIFSAVLGINAIEDDDERSGWPADANFGAAQSRNNHPAYHCRENAGLWSHP